MEGWGDPYLAHAVPYTSSEANNEETDDGVWVFVPTDTPTDQFTYEGSRTASGKIINFAEKRAQSAKKWFGSRIKSMIPNYDKKRLGGIAGAARAMCDVVAEKPALALVAVGAGAGLAYVATNVLLKGGFIYFCFVPHFNFYSSGESNTNCENCRSCQTPEKYYVKHEKSPCLAESSKVKDETKSCASTETIEVHQDFLTETDSTISNESESEASAPLAGTGLWY